MNQKLKQVVSGAMLLGGGLLLEEMGQIIGELEWELSCEKIWG